MTHDDETTIFCAYMTLHMLSKKSSSMYSGNLCHLQPILERYREVWRSYHTEAHIADGFRKIATVFEHINNPLVIYWTWLYHDSVYVPLAPTNELCSAKLAEHELKLLGLPAEVVQVAYESICATKDHLIPDNYSGYKDDLAILLDIDLSGLGDPHDLFVKVGTQLRQEALGVSEDDFNSGRAMFCRKMLERDTIFKTKHFKHLEEQARNNLKWAIKQST